MINVKVHWTHKAKIRKLYKEGYTHEELAIMYGVGWDLIKNVTRGIKLGERI